MTNKSEAAIAKLIGIHPRTFHNYCKGREPADRRELDKIARHFGTTTSYLLGLTDDSHKLLTTSSKNGAESNNEGVGMRERELLQSLISLSNDMAALRQDVRALTQKVHSMEADRHRPSRGRKMSS